MYAFLQLAITSLIIAAGIVITTYFQTAGQAQNTRAVSLAPAIVLSVVGLVRAGWTYVAMRRRIWQCNSSGPNLLGEMERVR